MSPKIDKKAIPGNEVIDHALAEAMLVAKKYLDMSVGARKEAASNDDAKKYPLTSSQKHSLSNYGYHAVADFDKEYSRSEADEMFIEARKHYNDFQKDHGNLKPVTGENCSC